MIFLNTSNFKIINTITKITQWQGHQSAIFALAAFQEDKILSAAGDGWVVAWDLVAPEKDGVLVARANVNLYAIAVASAEWLVAGDMNGGVHWLNLVDNSQNRHISHHQKGIFGIAVFNEWVFTVGGDGVLTRWSLTTQRSIESLKISHKSLRSIHIQAQKILIGASDGNFYVLDLGLNILHIQKNAHTSSVFTARFSPCGTRIWSGGRDAMLRVWDTENFTLIHEKAAHWFAINALVFSPCGRFIATGSRDKTIRIWSLEDNFELLKEINTIKNGGHLRSVNSLLWQQDCLISASDDRTLMVWEVLLLNDLKTL